MFLYFFEIYRRKIIKDIQEQLAKYASTTMTSFSKASKSPKNNVEKHVLRKVNRKSSKSTYKHVPHSEKPPHLVAKRNARERRRVQAVNSAFSRLRRHIPYEAKHKRLSKVKTLRFAIEYIRRMTEMIEQHDRQYGRPCCQFNQHVSLDERTRHGTPCDAAVVYSSWPQELRVHDGNY